LTGSFYLGVDSGGTKTEVVLLASDGSCVAQLIGGPIRLGVRASPKWIDLLAVLMDSAIKQAGLTREDIAFYGFGLCGVDFADELAMQRRTLFHGLNIDGEKAALVNDGIVALWGGSPKGQAAILQLGTAYTAAYRRSFGQETPFDHLNAGIVIDIRRRILTTVARMVDGRQPTSILKELIMQHFGFTDELLLLKRGVRNKLPLWELLTVIAPWKEAVEAGDPVSTAIVREAAEVYSADVLFLIGQTGAENADIVLGGGLLANGPEMLTELIKQKVLAEKTRVTIHKPLLSPGYGGAVMAAYYAGADYQALYERALAKQTSV